MLNTNYAYTGGKSPVPASDVTYLTPITLPQIYTYLFYFTFNPVGCLIWGVSVAVNSKPLSGTPVE